MSVNVPGIVATIVFYIIIAVIGIIAGRRGNKTGTVEEMFLANRNLGFFVCAMSITATLMGGSSIFGSSEIVGRDGIVWCILPFCQVMSGLIACIFFIPKVHGHGYTTIVDPFQQKYGKNMAVLPFISESICNIFWQASLFVALGSTLSFILETNMELAIVASASITIGYTIFGGLSSVAHTDVIQLLLIMIGLFLMLPFAIQHPAVNLDLVGNTLIGTVPTSMMGRYFDTICSCCLGPVTSQALYQRVLACRNVKIITSAYICGLVVYLICIIPIAVIGVVGRSTEWNMTDFKGEVPLVRQQWAHVFSMVLQFLCPPVVSVIGIGLVSAAVMSSADSAILATGSIFTCNIHNGIFRPNASDREQVWVLRLTIFCIGTIGALVAITVKSIFALIILASEMLYIVQFPQLVCVLWIPFSNTYGSVCGYLLGFIVRILVGEEFLGLPAVIKYPFYNEKYGQMFPYKSFTAGITFLTIVSVSYVTRYLFTTLKINRKYDVFNCYGADLTHGEITLSISENQQEGHELL